MVFVDLCVLRNNPHATLMHLKNSSIGSVPLSIYLFPSHPSPYASSKTLFFCCFLRLSLRSCGFCYSILHLSKCRWFFKLFLSQLHTPEILLLEFLWLMFSTEPSNFCWIFRENPSILMTAQALFWFFQASCGTGHFIESHFWVYLR